MRQVVLAAILAIAASRTARADEPDRSAVLRQVETQLGELGKGVWKGRLSGCGGWECDDATIYIQLPGKIDIRYDYGSRVVADGKSLRVLNGSGTEVRTDKLGETPLGLLLRARLDDVAAIDEIDRGTTAGEPRHVYQIELTSESSAPLTVYVARRGARLLGWRVADGRGEFTATIRGLHRVSGAEAGRLPRNLFVVAAARPRKGKR